MARPGMYQLQDIPGWSGLPAARAGPTVPQLTDQEVTRMGVTERYLRLCSAAKRWATG